MSIGAVLTSTLPTAQPKAQPTAADYSDRTSSAEDTTKSVAASATPTPSPQVPSHRGQNVNTTA
jgi:hypothetical protein